MRNPKLIRKHKFLKRESTQRSIYMKEARKLIKKYDAADVFHVTMSVHQSCFEQLKKEFPDLLITRYPFLDYLCPDRNHIMISVTYPKN